MKTTKQLIFAGVLLTVLFSGKPQPKAAPAGTAFTYQGQLNDGGNAAAGTYDLRFTIYDSASGGSAVAGTVTNAATAVSNGLFVVTLDFGGAVFTGSARWLEIAVRTNGAAAFDTLAPRQLLTPTPYAVMASGASNLLGTLPAAQLSGTIPNGSLMGLYSGPISLANPLNAFTGNGSGLTGVNASTLGGLGAASFWQLNGNAGTSPGVNYLGSRDNQPVELKVNTTRALRIEPTAGTPNLIGGYSGNFVSTGAVGAVVGGGGAAGFVNQVTDSYGTVAGGLSNSVLKNDSFIGGGSGNTVAADRSVIGGGRDNTIGTNASNSTLGGGRNNFIQTNSPDSVVTGGRDNRVETATSVFGTTVAAVISGGTANIVAGTNSTLAGGATNISIGKFSTVGGGTGNQINDQYDRSGPYPIFFPGGAYGYGVGSTIGGGVGNKMIGSVHQPYTATYATIAGGAGNTIYGRYNGSSIGGGSSNNINDFSSDCAIAGGAGNGMGSTGAGSIAGGAGNYIDGVYGKFVFYMTIAGGVGNHITGSKASVIGGGEANSITDPGEYPYVGSSTISGGSSNLISAIFGTIPGGYSNRVSGDYGFAAGRRAQAANQGAFVWADSADADFASTADNQFLIRAQGGVGINTNNPGGTALAVAGNARLTGLLRSGSETGSSQPPNPATGLVVRRINSSSTTTNQVVARNDVVTLERDGSNGGMLLRYTSAVRQTVACMALTSSGATVNLYTTISSAGAGTTQIFTDAQNVAYFRCNFGNPYQMGHQTEVVMSREGSDYWWSGTVTSTFNQ